MGKGVRYRAGPLAIGIGIGRLAPQVTMQVVHDEAKVRHHHETKGHT